MILFQRATGKNPDEFLAWARTVDPVEVQDLIDQVAETILSPGARFNFKIELRSFLRTNGYNNLPKGNLTYTLETWHKGYSKEQIRTLLSFLDDKVQKLYVYLCAETGFRAQTILDIKFRHIKEDFQKVVTDLEKPAPPLQSVAIRLGPEFFNKKKAAGYWYLGRTTIELIRQLINEGRITEKEVTKDGKVTRKGLTDEAPLIDKQYMTIWKVLNNARDKSGIDPLVEVVIEGKKKMVHQIQISHGFRKYFENALDQVQPRMDENRKRVYEGHFTGTRGKHYSARGWDDEDARNDFLRAYPTVSVEGTIPEQLVTRVQEIEVRGTAKEQQLEKLIGELVQKVDTMFKAFIEALPDMVTEQIASTKEVEKAVKEWDSLAEAFRKKQEKPKS